jgi:hypothetical protein
MAELTNLTDRIAHLRDRKGSSPIVQGAAQKPPPAKRISTNGRERKFATDYFMWFVYGLLVIALVAQIVLIIWLDLI